MTGENKLFSPAANLAMQVGIHGEPDQFVQCLVQPGPFEDLRYTGYVGRDQLMESRAATEASLSAAFSPFSPDSPAIYWKLDKPFGRGPVMPPDVGVRWTPLSIH